MERVPVLLLALLAAASAINIAEDETAQLKRVLGSPITQTLAERLGLQLPEVPEFNIDFRSVDINALLGQATDIGCVPEGVQVSEAVQSTVQRCVGQAYRTAVRSPLARPNRRRANRRGRSLLDVIKQRAVNNGMLMAQQCILRDLELTGEDGALNQTSVEAIIDDMTADDEFKTQMKFLVDVCFTYTPEELNDASQRLQFQLACIGKLSKLECSLSVADNVSPTLGLIMRFKHGKCLKALQPPARALMAQTACAAEEVSTLMRGRLDETATSTGRRRRRNADIMSKMQMPSMENIEEILGTATKRTCRQTRRGRRCTTTRAKPSVSLEQLNETLARAEELYGPLDEAFANVPEMVLGAASCWHTTMGTEDGAGGVDVAALRALAVEAEGPDMMRAALVVIIDTCDSKGAASSVDSFDECFTEEAAYACAMVHMLEGWEQKATSARG
ncbi:uncharacterized protein LOC122376627 [Amphibalanus amphitrite]|uniref:uncharacterized protein LOC122376627 n=1 Tax=Amphibalanus amphitrite TaxID=1232801 RepID=UPI001C8FEB50|nr:uncharacterized protein LOC122376627 [Amphibalanus amphitrite]